MLEGRPLVWYPYAAARRCDLVDRVVVATDDARILDTCDRLGMPAVMTGRHTTGTDRLAEAASRLDGDLFVNVQGDEPLTTPTAVEAVIICLRQLRGSGGGDVVNGCAPLTSNEDLTSHNTVKVAVGASGDILYYSRAVIPSGGGYQRYRQLGLYGFTRAAVERFAAYERGPLERAEDVEMLRFLEHGDPVRLVGLPAPGPAVDTPEDLQAITALLRSRAHDGG
jgi:3-deoxy-manno-octulosonate cytidylyltransferase (CMP-KDO synthetase)